MSATGLRRERGTDLLACGWLVGGVRVLLFAVDAPTGLPSGPFCLLFVGADMSLRSRVYVRSSKYNIYNQLVVYCASFGP